MQSIALRAGVFTNTPIASVSHLVPFIKAVTIPASTTINSPEGVAPELGREDPASWIDGCREPNAE